MTLPSPIYFVCVIDFKHFISGLEWEVLLGAVAYGSQKQEFLQTLYISNRNINHKFKSEEVIEITS